MDCPFCKGTGLQPNTLSTTCPVCNGYGELSGELAKFPTCRVCKGRGVKPHTISTPCDVCHGKGRRPPIAPQDTRGHPDKQSMLESDLPTVIRIGAGGPYQARQKIADLFAALTGDISVCDPWYGKGSLVSLSAFTACSSLRFLTKNPDRNERTFIGTTIKEFCTDYSYVQIHEYAGSDIHDRYVLGGDKLIILGHGLKDIGKKESFVVIFDRDTAGDLMDSLAESFEDKWSKSTPVA